MNHLLNFLTDIFMFGLGMNRLNCFFRFLNECIFVRLGPFLDATATSDVKVMSGGLDDSGIEKSLIEDANEGPSEK